MGEKRRFGARQWVVLWALSIVLSPVARAADIPVNPDDEPWITFYPQDVSYRSLLEVYLQMTHNPVNAWSYQNVRNKSLVLEIRSAMASERLVTIDSSAEMPNGAYQAVSSPVLSRAQIMKGPTLGAGRYLMAWMLDGRRCSDVVPLIIDPRRDLTKIPRISILQVEPQHAGRLPTVVAYVTRATEADPAPKNMGVAMGLLVFDGKTLIPNGGGYSGPNSPLGVGRTMRQPISTREIDPHVDLSKPHTIAVSIGEGRNPEDPLIKETFGGTHERSAPVQLETRTPLADMWDAFTPALGSVPKVMVLLSGKINAPSLPAGGRYQITLTNQNGIYREEAFSDIGYSFRNIPDGDYSVLVSPQRTEEPSITRSHLKVGAGGVTVFNVDMNGNYVMTGHVTHPDGTPAANVAITTTWTSTDGQWTCQANATTNASGEYSLSTPFPKSFFIGVSGADKFQARDLSSPTTNVDFQLLK